MANYSSSNRKKYGAQYVKDNADIIAIAINPLKTDTYTATMAKVIAQAAMTSGDVAITDSGDDLLSTINGKSIDPTSTAAANNDLVVLIINSAGSEIIQCMDATDRIITNETGDTVTIPAMLTYERELSVAP